MITKPATDPHITATLTLTFFLGEERFKGSLFGYSITSEVEFWSDELVDLSVVLEG